jgi:hypothetical protein
MPDRDKTMLDPKIHFNTSYNPLQKEADLKSGAKKRVSQPAVHRPNHDVSRPQDRIITNETFLDDAV